MKAIAPQDIPDTFVRTRTRAPKFETARQDTMEDSASIVAGVDQDRLIKSDEFEWTTPLNLPGLIVAGRKAQNPEAAPAWPWHRSMDEVLETEDGDAVTAIQLPGGLLTEVIDHPAMLKTAEPPNELFGDDEYVEARAMQLPGRLRMPVEAAEAPIESHGLRGLCASCSLRDCCVFPRPASGVWRCEEYA